MPELSDTQAIFLAAASQRPDGNILPLPGWLCGEGWAVNRKKTQRL